MLLYKFKDLSDPGKHSQFLQIALDRTVWCADPESLNDPDEFRFSLDYSPSPRTLALLTDVVARFRQTDYLPPSFSADLAIRRNRLAELARPIIKSMISQCRSTIGITSFSGTARTPLLWQRYGGGGYGAYVAIDVPDTSLGQLYHRVQYVPQRTFHVDDIFRAALDSTTAFCVYRNILLTKTRKWSEEQEIRFIGSRCGVNVKVGEGRIAHVCFGAQVPRDTLNRLVAAIRAGSPDVPISTLGAVRVAIS